MTNRSSALKFLSAAVCWLSASGIAAPACALSNNNISANAAQFLRLGAGARPLAVGEAYTAIADDADALYWNPAGLAGLSGPQASLTHTELFDIFRYDFLAVALPAPRLGGTLGLGLTLLRQDSIEVINKTGDLLGGNFSPRSLAAAAAYGRRLKLAGRDAAVGVSLKYINETLYTYSASALAADIGVIVKPAGRSGLRLAAALRHFGTKEKFINDAQSLPTELNLGAAYSAQRGKKIFTGAAELALPYYGASFIKVGLEYAVPVFNNVTLACRAGYKTLTTGGLGPLTGITAGIGLLYRKLEADMAFQSMGDLGLIYRLSLGYRFGEQAKLSKARDGAETAGNESDTAASAARTEISTAAAVMGTISPEEVKRWMSEGRRFDLIDVRSPDEFLKQRLVGARNVPFYEISGADIPRDRALVLYCSQVSCSLSGDSAAALLKRGYADVRVLEGGIENALAQGLAAERVLQDAAASSRCGVYGAELQDKLGRPDPPQLIDLRPELEFKAGHISNALNIPLERLNAAASALPRDKELTVYDRLPERSGQGAEILRRNGLRACELEGGIASWTHEGRPLQ